MPTDWTVMDKQYLTIEDLAQRLSVSPHTVRFWRRSGTGPTATKIGKQVRYSIEDVEEWLRSRREDA